ncbi:MAG TPA: hypothetical protein VIE43_22310 [Thermoanaerobaculia bacterium]|nr:hypothetical protein [Thermoanaerobaculia bacterium]
MLQESIDERRTLQIPRAPEREAVLALGGAVEKLQGSRELPVVGPPESVAPQGGCDGADAGGRRVGLSAPSFLLDLLQQAAGHALRDLPAARPAAGEEMTDHLLPQGRGEASGEKLLDLIVARMCHDGPFPPRRAPHFMMA